MADESEDKLFQTYLERGKQYGYTDEKLTAYVEARLKEAQDRADRQREREAKAEMEKEIAQEKAKAEIEKEKAKAEIEKEKAQAKAKVEIEREKAEIEKCKIEVDAKVEMERERTKQIQIQAGNAGSPSKVDVFGGKSHGPVPRLPKLPTFKEKTDDIDSFLYRFEAQAQTSKWPKGQWAVFLAAYLEGSALTLYHSLAEGNVDLTYDSLKENLLKKFSCTAEGFRSRFRFARPEEESFDIFAVELRRLFDRWISLSSTDKSYECLVDLLLREQLMCSVSKEVATFLWEKDLETFQEMVAAAEAYRRAHPGKTMARKGETTVFGGASGYEPQSQQQGGSFGNHNINNRGQAYRGRGNRHRNRGPRRGVGSSRGGYGDSNRGGYGSSRGSYGESRGGYSSSRGGYGNSNQGGYNATDFRCYICNRTGHFARDCSAKPKMVTCQVPEQDYKLYYAKAAHCEEEQEQTQHNSSCAHVVCSSIQDFAGQLSLEGGTVNGVACSVLRDTGANVCGVRKRLVREDQFLGERAKCVSFGGRVEEFELAEVQVDCQYIQKKIVCCVLEAPVADLIIGNIPDISGDSKTQQLSAAVTTRARSRQQVEQKPLAQCADVINVSKAELVQKQRQDSSLKACFDLAKSGEVRTAGSTSHFFHITDDVLYRTFKEGDKTTEQVVVPESLRPAVMAISHDLILSGHCGARRTLARIREKFHWPGVTVDVGRYVASCDVCQRTTPKGRVAPVPLAQVPLIGTPFHRVAIDLVGPFTPASEKGSCIRLCSQAGSCSTGKLGIAPSRGNISPLCGVSRNLCVSCGVSVLSCKRTIGR